MSVNEIAVRNNEKPPPVVGPDGGLWAWKREVARSNERSAQGAFRLLARARSALEHLTEELEAGRFVMRRMRQAASGFRHPGMVWNLVAVSKQEIPQRIEIRTAAYNAALAGDARAITNHVHAEMTLGNARELWRALAYLRAMRPRGGCRPILRAARSPARRIRPGPSRSFEHGCTTEQRAGSSAHPACAGGH